MLGLPQCAARNAAEKTIAVAGDASISSITQRGGNERHKGGDPWPRIRQEPKNLHRGRRLGVRPVFEHQNHGAVRQREVVPPQQRDGVRVLQWQVGESMLAIALFYEAHRMVTQAADAIVEQQGGGRSWCHLPIVGHWYRLCATGHFPKY